MADRPWWLSMMNLRWKKLLEKKSWFRRRRCPASNLRKCCKQKHNCLLRISRSWRMKDASRSFWRSLKLVSNQQLKRWFQCVRQELASTT